MFKETYIKCENFVLFPIWEWKEQVVLSVPRACSSIKCQKIGYLGRRYCLKYGGWYSCWKILLLEDTSVLPQSQYFCDIIGRRILNNQILTLTLLEAQMTSLKRFLLVFWEQWEWRRPGQKSSLSLYILSSDRTEVQSCRFCHLHSSKMTSSQPEAH